MARSTTNDQLFLNDGTGQALPIATGVWQTKAIDMQERRRLSVTANFLGGFTGIFAVQGTDELNNCAIQYGTGPSVAWAGAGTQPGQNGFTGALCWSNLLPGVVSVTNSTTIVRIDLSEVNTRWIRFVFNPGITTAIGSAVGTGAVQLFFTAKNT